MTTAIPQAVSALSSAASAAEGTSSVAGGTARAAAAKKTARPRPPRPAGAAAAKKTAAPEAPASRRQSTGGTRPQRPQGSQRRGLSIPRPAITAGGAAHRLVVAEFIVCIVLVGVTPVLTRKPGKDGKLYVPNDFVRLSAVCLLFFILALASNSPRSSRVAAAFGALVTLGVFYNASGSLTAIANIFINTGQSKGNVSAASAGTASIHMVDYTPTDLSKSPSDFGQSSASSGGSTVSA